LQPELDESTSISFDQVVRGLYKPGIAGFPSINSQNLGISSRTLNKKLDATQRFENQAKILETQKAELDQQIDETN
jgi:uncharacterized tellurite resistance protein B-like protein